MKRTVAISLLIMVVSACASTRGPTMNAGDTSNTPERISAADLMQAFKNNPSNADQLYKGRTLLVTGILQNNGKGQFGRSAFLEIMTDDNPYRWVVCESTDQKWMTDVTTVRLGQQVAFIGAYDTFELLNNKVDKVRLTNCRLAEK